MASYRLDSAGLLTSCLLFHLDARRFGNAVSQLISRELNYLTECTLGSWTDKLPDDNNDDG